VSQEENLELTTPFSELEIKKKLSLTVMLKVLLGQMGCHSSLTRNSEISLK
jgi:hypothetical protein